jgi:hypothetical protein
MNTGFGELFSTDYSFSLPQVKLYIKRILCGTTESTLEEPNLQFFLIGCFLIGVQTPTHLESRASKRLCMRNRGPQYDMRKRLVD